MLLNIIKSKNNGNISILALVLTTLFAFLFLLVFDLCKIFVGREMTKNASDAASMAAAQNLLFFEDVDCKKIAAEIANENGCVLIDCSYNYNEVVVIVEKKLDFVLIDIFTAKYCRVQAMSKSEIIYPWDDQFGFCKYYKFRY
ncbi:MAG: hypothetical protein ISS13_03495 [Actinobacteria bacterium]|nr:hypothetical protein [Actinomycetota bacterium]MBL7060883.1 hypothetical protein [Actinomycetota bacterium]